MKPGAVEALKAVVRRSWPLLVVLCLVGAAAVNGLRQYQGPSHRASARVYVSPTDLGAALTNTAPSYIDAQRLEKKDLALASSLDLFERVAREWRGTLGSAQEIRAVTRVSAGDDNILTFTVTRPHQRRAVATADAVAAEYIQWRADLAGATLRQAISQLRDRIGDRAEGKAQLVALLNKLEVLETLNSGGATVVERATEARKVNPAPVRDSILGGAIGLVVALLLVGAREALNTKVRSENDVEEALALPLLGTIQTLPRGARIVTIGRHERVFGDKYALLAANLAQLRSGAERPVLAVTSAVAAEGKTTTATNLAVSLARRGARVVLADFDVRKPSVANVFGIPPDAPGLAQIVAEDGDPQAMLWVVPLDGPGPTAVRPDRALGRSLLAAGGNGSAAASGGGGSLLVLPAGGLQRAGTLAQSPRLPGLLGELRASADYVVLDTPPALLTAEMAELARHVDTVLIVVRQGRVSRRSLRTLSRQAQSWPAEFVGAVVTDAPQDEEHYAYYRAE
jgi:succinoglycan biosynthesis transport protein ExoP